VPDPRFGTEKDYDEVYYMIIRACDAIIERAPKLLRWRGFKEATLLNYLSKILECHTIILMLQNSLRRGGELEGVYETNITAGNKRF